MGDYWKVKDAPCDDQKKRSNIDPDKMFNSRISKKKDASSASPQQPATPSIDFDRLALDRKNMDRLASALSIQRRSPMPRGFHDPDLFFGDGNNKAF